MLFEWLALRNESQLRSRAAPSQPQNIRRSQSPLCANLPLFVPSSRTTGFGCHSKFFVEGFVAGPVEGAGVWVVRVLQRYCKRMPQCGRQPQCELPILWHSQDCACQCLAWPPWGWQTCLKDNERPDAQHHIRGNRPEPAFKAVTAAVLSI